MLGDALSFLASVTCSKSISIALLCTVILSSFLAGEAS